MNIRAIGNYLGRILIVEGIFMVPALVLALVLEEQPSAVGFAATAAVVLLIGAFLARQKRNQEGIYAREGFFTVALGWILISLFGALPFFISGAIPDFMDCWFETVSGFTTTGASILANVEALPKSMLYWRSFTHWLGGMGVLVFMLAVSPFSPKSGESFLLMRMESTGPSVGKLTPKLRETARILYLIYFALTLVEIVLLLFGGMPVFDSILHAFGTAGTGGFGIKNASVAAYDSTYLHMVIAVFMMLFGINFSLFYMLLLRQFRAVARNEELRLYLGLIVVVTLLIAFNILPQYGGNFGLAVRDSYFQVSSIITTTGYSTANFDLWPELSRFLLVLLMVIGGCAGSTAGGMKVSRVLLLVKSLLSELLTMLRPRAVKPVRMDKKTVEPAVLQNTAAFLTAYALICAVSILLISPDGHSLETNATAVISCVSNIGPGLSKVGPAENFGFLSHFSKFVLSLDMLTGRLEIFPLLLLFSPNSWKKRA